MKIRALFIKVGTGRLFLLTVFLAYAFVAVIDLPLFYASINGFVTMSLSILPVLALVFFVMFLFNLALDVNKTLKYLGNKSGIKGWTIAIISGILSAGPIYMWYPLLADLKERGMKTSLIATFLYNRAVKIPLLPVMIYYFGWGFAAVLTMYMIIFSVVIGLIVGKIAPNKEVILK